MKIDKAIEILAQHQKGTDLLYLPDFSEATKLGIEALQRVNDMRTSPCTTADERLPGETEE